MANEKSRFEINGTSYDLHDAKAVKFDRTQSLTAAQKQKARDNIGAGSADDVGALSAAMAYVVSGNKSIETATIPVGAYVRLVGSTIAGRSDGIYTVAIAIPVNTVIGGTYFNESAPIPGGVANASNASLIRYVDVQLESYHFSSGGIVRFNVIIQSGETELNKRISVRILNDENTLAAWLGGKGGIYIRSTDDQTIAPNIRIYYMK